MQLFITDPNLFECARHLDDKRLNKIIIESAQIASTALWMNNCDVAETLTSIGKCYLPTHENHPLCKWASESFINYEACLEYCESLCLEYEYRFNKIHKTYDVYYGLSYSTTSYIDSMPGPLYRNQIYINATTNHKHIEDVYEAYKQELNFKWNNDKKYPTWTNRVAPKFFINNRNRMIDLQLKFMMAFWRFGQVVMDFCHLRFLNVRLIGLIQRH